MIELTEYTIGLALAIVLGLILADTLAGILCAAMRDELKIQIAKLPQYLRTGVAPYMGALSVLALLAGLTPGTIAETFRAAFYGSAALAAGKYIADILAKVKSILEKDE